MTAPDPRLGEIEARLNAASIHDGPWAVEESDWGCKVYVDEHGFGTMYICEDLNQQHDGRNDAEFIANAPADVAYLLAELRTAREALAEAWAEGHESGFWNGRLSQLTVPYDAPDPLIGKAHADATNPYRAAVAAAGGGGE